MTAPTLAPVTADNWRLHAACAMPGVDPEIFFRANGNRSDIDNRRRRTQALNVCAHCPARRQCIEDEFRYGSQDGRRSMTRGGWWWTSAAVPRPHPADDDLMRTHYPKETR